MVLLVQSMSMELMVLPRKAPSLVLVVLQVLVKPRLAFVVPYKAFPLPTCKLYHPFLASLMAFHTFLRSIHKYLVLQQIQEVPQPQDLVSYLLRIRSPGHLDMDLAFQQEGSSQMVYQHYSIRDFYLDLPACQTEPLLTYEI